MIKPLETYSYTIESKYTERDINIMYLKWLTDKNKYDYIFTIIYKHLWNLMQMHYASKYESSQGNRYKLELIQDTLTDTLWLGADNFNKKKGSIVGLVLTSFDNAVKDQRKNHGFFMTDSLDELLEPNLNEETADEAIVQEPKELVVEDNPASHASAAEMQEVAEATLRALPDDMRTAFVLHKQLGYTAQQAAEHMGLSPGNIRQLAHRARMAMIGSIYAH